MFEQKRTCLLSVRRSVVITAAFAFCFAGGAVADSVPGTVSSDPFDSSQGTIVVNDDTIIDPINAFRTTGGFENGHTLMRNGGLDSISFINFDTPSAVSIIGVRLFAANDLDGCCLRRAMKNFKLFADTDGDSVFETTVVDQAINPDYQFQPGNNAAAFNHLDLTLLTSGAVTARHWRLEVTQGSNIQPFEGARLVELDAIPSIAQLCPCENEGQNHGAYVSCVTHAAEDYVARELISEAQKDAIVAEAGASSCGK